MAAPDWWRNWNRRQQRFNIVRDPTAPNPVNTNNLPMDQRAWLDTEPRWKNRVGKGWVAKKVLGEGGYGIVGHWSYEGIDRRARRLVDIAIKQAVFIDRAGIQKEGLTAESEFLSLFAPAKSPHIIRMYKSLQQDMGRGSFAFDNGTVHRILMEYCPGGDGHKLVYGHGQWKSVSEAQCWAVFHCIARGLCVMDRGTENSEAIRWNEAEIVHFDFKLRNLLIGNDIADDEHRDSPAYKIADFGLTLRAPATPDLGFSIRHHARGTQFSLVPEQVRNKRHQDGERPWTKNVNALSPANVQFGARCNIWQLGLVIWELMNAPFGRSIEQNGWQQMACYRSTMSPRLVSGGETIGCKVDIHTDGKDGQRYSQLLRTAVAECLLIDGSKRPNTLELFQTTKNGLDGEHMSQGSLFQYQQFPPYSEPTLSAEWYTNNSMAPPPVLNAAQVLVVRKKEQIAKKAAEIALQRSVERKAALNGIISNVKLSPPAPGIAIPFGPGQAISGPSIAYNRVDFVPYNQTAKDRLLVSQALAQQPQKAQLQNQIKRKPVPPNPNPPSDINLNFQDQPNPLLPPNPNARNVGLAASHFGAVEMARQIPIPPSDKSCGSFVNIAPPDPMAGVMHALPVNLRFIVERKPGWLGSPVTKNYALVGLDANMTVNEVKKRLEARDGVVKAGKMLMRNGVEVMDDWKILGHFQLRAILRVKEL